MRPTSQSRPQLNQNLIQGVQELAKNSGWVVAPSLVGRILGIGGVAPSLVVRVGSDCEGGGADEEDVDDEPVHGYEVEGESCGERLCLGSRVAGSTMV